jgi:hypothetical protein
MISPIAWSAADAGQHLALARAAVVFEEVIKRPELRGQAIGGDSLTLFWHVNVRRCVFWRFMKILGLPKPMNHLKQTTGLLR